MSSLSQPYSLPKPIHIPRLQQADKQANFKQTMQIAMHPVKQPSTLSFFNLLLYPSQNSLRRQSGAFCMCLNHYLLKRNIKRNEFSK